MYELPIKDVEFHYQQDLVFSMDQSVVKIWDKNNVRIYFYHKKYGFIMIVFRESYLHRLKLLRISIIYA